MEFIKSKTLAPISLNPFSYFSQNSENKDLTESRFNSGIIRDRFETFFEYRNSFQNRFFHFLEKDIFKDSNSALENSSIFNDSDEKKVRLLSSMNLELNSLKDKKSINYLEIFHNTEIIYKELIKDMNLLKRKQQERIKTKVYESENKQIDKEIEKIIKSMTQKVKICEINIKEITTIPDSNLSNIDIKIKDNMRITLSQKIHDFSYEFRKNEEQFVEKLKKLGTNSSVIDDEDTSIKDFEKKHSTDFLFNKYDNNNSQLEKRNECIDSLLLSINELSSIFKDLQTVVQEQGTILDRIDYNIDIAWDNTKKAYGHISEANKLQKTSCFRNSTLIVMFIIFFESILLINKYL